MKVESSVTFCVVIWTTALFSPLLFHHKDLARRSAALVAGLLLLKIVSWLPSALIPPMDYGDEAQALRKLAGHPTASNFTPSSVASYTDFFSGWLKPEAVTKLLLTGRVTPDDYSMIFEADRNNPLYAHPEYYVLFKGIKPDEQLEHLAKAGFVPIRQGNSYAIFAVPRRPN